MRYAVVWVITEVKFRATMLSYWIRPYDSHLDDRRWRWKESGCAASRRIWASWEVKL